MIDVSTFQSQETRWQDLYVFLKSEGFDVYAPGQHKGDCLSPYIVIKNSSSTRVFGLSTNQDLYLVMIYVPQKHYSQVEQIVADIRQRMRKIYPLFKEYGQITEAFYDDSVKGYMVSIMFSNYKKIDL